MRPQSSKRPNNNQNMNLSQIRPKSAKEKQISTFLECKKTFFGKFKYYFKYSKKKNKTKIFNSLPKEPCNSDQKKNFSHTLKIIFGSYSQIKN